MPKEPTTGTNGTTRYVGYDGSVNVGGDRNWRNNNPGNIEAGRFANEHGAIGSDGRFAIFPTPEVGMQALHDLLCTDTYQDLSVEKAIERFAPPHENDTAAYTSYIAEHVGVDPSTNMSDLSPEQMDSVMSAINHFEGGNQGTTHTAGDPVAPDWVKGILWFA